MTESTTSACTLRANELQRRLATIAAIGGEGLLAYDSEDDRHLLRFEASPSVRRRLHEVVAAEAKCCSFLDLSLSEAQGTLVLSIAAPDDAKPIAAALARIFTEAARKMAGQTPPRRRAPVGSD